MQISLNVTTHQALETPDTEVTLAPWALHRAPGEGDEAEEVPALRPPGP